MSLNSAAQPMPWRSLVARRRHQDPCRRSADRPLRRL